MSEVGAHRESHIRWKVPKITCFRYIYYIVYLLSTVLLYLVIPFNAFRLGKQVRTIIHYSLCWNVIQALALSQATRVIWPITLELNFALLQNRPMSWYQMYYCIKIHEVQFFSMVILTFLRHDQFRCGKQKSLRSRKLSGVWECLLCIPSHKGCCGFIGNWLKQQLFTSELELKWV